MKSQESITLSRFTFFRVFMDLIVDEKRIPFHLKIDIDDSIFNSKFNDNWLDEIELGKVNWPLMSIQNITLTITQNEGFQVSVKIKKNIGSNDLNMIQIELATNPAVQVQRRDSLSDVKTVRVYGMFNLQILNIKDGPGESLLTFFSVSTIQNILFNSFRSRREIKFEINSWYCRCISSFLCFSYWCFLFLEWFFLSQRRLNRHRKQQKRSEC